MGVSSLLKAVKLEPQVGCCRLLHLPSILRYLEWKHMSVQFMARRWAVQPIKQLKFLSKFLIMKWKSNLKVWRLSQASQGTIFRGSQIFWCCSWSYVLCSRVFWCWPMFFRTPLQLWPVLLPGHLDIWNHENYFCWCCHSNFWSEQDFIRKPNKNQNKTLPTWWS